MHLRFEMNIQYYNVRLLFKFGFYVLQTSVCDTSLSNCQFKNLCLLFSQERNHMDGSMFSSEDRKLFAGGSLTQKARRMKKIWKSVSKTALIDMMTVLIHHHCPQFPQVLGRRYVGTVDTTQLCRQWWIKPEQMCLGRFLKTGLYLGLIFDISQMFWLCPAEVCTLYPVPFQIPPPKCLSFLNDSVWR